MFSILCSLAIALALLPPPPEPSPPLWIGVDRGVGATYQLGEPVVIRVTVPQPAYVRVLATADTGTGLVAEGYVASAGKVTAIAGPPAGVWTLTLEIDRGGHAAGAQPLDVPTPIQIALGPYGGTRPDTYAQTSYTVGAEAGKQR